MLRSLTNKEAAPTGDSDEATTSDSWGAIVHFAGRFGLLLLLALLTALFSSLRPSSFGTWHNYNSILSTQTVPIVIALAEMLVLIIGHFDLSVAANLGLSQVLVIGLISQSHLNTGIAIVVAISISTLAGLASGIIVVRFVVGSLVTTLAVGSVLEGAQLWYTKGGSLFAPISKNFTQLGRNSVGPIQYVVLFTAGVCAVLWFILEFLPVGRKMYVLGGNERAARLTGIHTGRYTVGVFGASGLLCGIGGVMFGAQLGTAQPGGGDSLLIPAFTGALLSLTTIKVGRYNVWGVVVAILTLSITVSGLQQLGAPIWVQPVFNGVALIIAIGLSSWAVRARAEAARRVQLQKLSRGTAAVTRVR